MHHQLNIAPVCLILGITLLPLISYAQDLESTTKARELARQADAEILAKKTYNSAQKSLTRAIKLLEENNNPDKVTAAFLDATEYFSVAQLEALNKKLLDHARNAINDADDLRAKRYAPITRGKAHDLLDAAEVALEADRYATETISELANQAAVTARHAGQIAILVRSKPDLEELILKWETYINRLELAAGINISTDTDPDDAVSDLEGHITKLYTANQQLQRDLSEHQAFAAALENEIRELDNELGGASAERHQLILELEGQARTEEQLTQTEELFLPSEALVFKQSNTIVVRLIGLKFSSGSAKFDERHTELLSKIKRAINIYPDSNLSIEGHTDAQGSADMNQRLSQERADAVLAYIINSLHIIPQRISAIGYGASRPIANNNTAKGRAKNRRIDLLITPVKLNISGPIPVE
ncbi:MAG: OmpA family protein [Gammaproteobacteria bacterium]|nr:OmpA family protein [Gammaproteobacteria bacterium]MCP4089065.1 OmpA family protein [Gammaproteobacteria bacterium]MCP4278001.1 OmpA family protein [Gammaproteobacteria bacterium]MCP4833011.1 OmpA family protein [Gammaproteobacteria bacterium]MCP4928617.1 OmpA family protein [Gammaproteobacteria bacterium]